MGILRELYGDEAFNSLLLVIFEFFSYLLAGMLGSITREIFFEKKKKLSRVIGSSLISSFILLITTSFTVVKLEHMRLVFGIGAILGFYVPNFMGAIASGRIIKYAARMFSPKLYEILKEIEEDEKKGLNRPE